MPPHLASTARMATTTTMTMAMAMAIGRARRSRSGCDAGVPVPTTTSTAQPPPTSTTPTPTPYVDGAALYTQHCANCHGTSKKGSSATSIQSAISKNTGGMGSLSFLTPEQIAAISAAP